MKHLILVTVTAMAFAVATAGDEHQHMSGRLPAFDRLLTLAGVWTGKDDQGNPLTVSYRIVSDSSALMETMDMGENKGVMVTMYHPDGGTIMVTHYCSMGNQPRMKCAGLAEDGMTLEFSYIDATNLATPDADRMEGLTVRFKDADHFTQQWTARVKGGSMEQVVFEYAREE